MEKVKKNKQNANVREFEIITDTSTKFKVFLNVLKYRSPHIHSDYEIGLLMQGNINIIYEDKQFQINTGDIICVNPYQLHELRSDENAQILFLQVNPSYFSSIFPQIKNMEFLESVYHKNDGTIYESMHRTLLQLALCYMEEPENYELLCTGLLNILFYNLLAVVPHKNMSNTESIFVHNKAARIRRIADYIEDHHEEKIMLSDIADHEGLTITYLSHFFRDNFHMTFQDYLTKLRCEKARRLMLTTDLSLLDISISCGFSDPKYFKSGFIKQYGCSPKEYRLDFNKQKLPNQQSSMLTTQQILSKQTSRVLLEKYISA